MKGKKTKKKLENSLLDVSIHNHLMQDMTEKDKRGRPDIIHTALLLALGSRLNKDGYLRIYIHTRNDEIITINPKDNNGKQTWQRGRVYDIKGNCPTICATLFDQTK